MSTSTCYNIVVYGEPGVGKTCFIDQFCYGKSFVPYDLDNSALSHKILVDDRAIKIKLMDLSTSFLKPEQSMHPAEWAKGILAGADGVVLLYDVTNSSSLNYVTNQAYRFLWDCRGSKCAGTGETKRKSFGCVIVGNKHDLVSTENAHKVNQKTAEEWAQSQGIRSIEVASVARAGPECALKLLVKHIWKLERLGLMEAKGGVEQQNDASPDQPESSIVATLRKVFE